MPCSSSHMEPSTRERLRGSKIIVGLNELADRLTHDNDVLREYILGEVTFEHKVILPLLNRVRDYRKALTTLRDQKKGLYDLAVPKEAPGLFDHVTDLLMSYEFLNDLATRQRVMTKEDHDYLVREQNLHREEDLKRLMKVFSKTSDRERLRIVLDADNTKPLEPQLGFSPDDF